MKNLQKMFVSVDGAMVPLVGGEWAEVKTLTIGEIQKPVLERGEWVVHSQNHSYFSRMTESSLFRRLALVETTTPFACTTDTLAADIFNYRIFEDPIPLLWTKYNIVLALIQRMGYLPKP